MDPYPFFLKYLLFLKLFFNSILNFINATLAPRKLILAPSIGSDFTHSNERIFSEQIKLKRPMGHIMYNKGTKWSILLFIYMAIKMPTICELVMFQFIKMLGKIYIGFVSSYKTCRLNRSFICGGIYSIYQIVIIIF